MIVVGLHFGHDANMAVYRDNELLGFYERERHTRVRHAIGLTGSAINDFLARFGIGMADVDVCTITTTQGVPIIDWDGGLHIALRGERRVPLAVHDGNPYLDNMPPGHAHRVPLSATPEPAQRIYVIPEQFPALSLSNRWVASHAGIAAMSPLVDLGSHHIQEIEFSLHGRAPKQAWFVSHHLAHAQYAYYFSPFGKPLVVTLDGTSSNDFAGGGIYLGIDGKSRPIVAHGFWCGPFYNRVAEHLGFGGIARAGKLMGLAAYGMPIYAQPELVGTLAELQGRGPFPTGAEIAEYWLHGILSQGNAARTQWNGQDYPPELHANIAASAQWMFQHNVDALLSVATTMARRNSFDFDGIVLAGGCALNCPANSLLAQKYGRVFIPPATNDEGLGLGSAALFLSQPSKPSQAGPQIAYLGGEYAISASEVQERWGDQVEVVATGDTALQQLAQAIHTGAIVGFHHGAAEVGPRALGHRSILASPLRAENWARVNRLKQREPWRPLAPIATERAARDDFTHLPDSCHFMLFNGRVKSRHLPAVTHVDGTARVQVATSDCGPVYALLQAFGALSGHEVLLNTSFNGRGEPIVETPEDAVQGMLRLGLDLLYLNGMLLAPRKRP